MKVHFLFLFILSHTVLAHQGTLQGHVYDAVTKKPLSSATILVAGTKFSAVTNDLGEFKVKGIGAGNYQASVFSLGFEIVSNDFKISDAETTNLDFYLKVGTIDLSELKVQAPHAHTQQLISSIDIKLRPQRQESCLQKSTYITHRSITYSCM